MLFFFVTTVFASSWQKKKNALPKCSEGSSTACCKFHLHEILDFYGSKDLYYDLLGYSAMK
jgi:hypothetical protein